MNSMLISVGISLAIGAFLATVYSVKGKRNNSFITMLVMLPAVVCMVVLMVNGSIGTGLAVAGAFSLVRFRSAPGNARDIGTIFLAMACGLITGMGEYLVAIVFAIIMGLVFIVLSLIHIGGNSSSEKILKITIPEGLNYGNVFENLFKEYLSKYEIMSVKTSNMGSLYKLSYNVILKNSENEKAFLDELRCRNGNLEVGIYKKEDEANEL